MPGTFVVGAAALQNCTRASPAFRQFAEPLGNASTLPIMEDAESLVASEGLLPRINVLATQAGMFLLHPLFPGITIDCSPVCCITNI
jgi:hypothetical protein